MSITLSTRVLRLDMEDSRDQWRLHFYRIGAARWQVECSIHQFVGTGGWSEKFIAQYTTAQTVVEWSTISQRIAQSLADFLLETNKEEHARAAERLIRAERQRDIEIVIKLIAGLSSSAGMAI